VSALCWCGGLVISAFGIYIHQMWLMWLGAGVIGGIGLGLGYISPVSTLIKWFPDRRGMATGMAIMGFGGGAMVGAPLADWLMRFYATPVSVGVWETFLTMAAIYFVFMLAGAFAYRVPASGWAPAGWAPAATQISNVMITSRHVHLEKAWKTPQFWLIWSVLCLNVSAGIGILGMASPLLQEVFGGKLIGVDVAFNDLTAAQNADRNHCGRLYRFAVLIQYRRAVFLGFVFRLPGAQGNLFHFLCSWVRFVCVHPQCW
jgi:MFS family permease